MRSTSANVRKSSARLIKKAVAAVEMLESRAYLTGVVFGTPHNVAAAGAGIAPAFLNIDTINSKVDLISANQQNGSVPNSISILPGNGDGTFSTAQRVPLAFSPLTIAEADFNRDGALDIVAGSPTSGVIGVTLNNGSGVFGSAADFTATGLANTRSIAIGDFNGDGAPDVAALSYDSSVNPGTPNLAIFLNNGSGSFTLSQTLTLNHAHEAALTAFTPASGGHVDLAVANQDNNSVTIVTNDGSGTFTVGSDVSAGSGPVSITTADFNSDNKADLVVADSTGGSVSTLLGNGDGTFQSGVASAVSGVPAGGGPLKVRTANINNDGKPDLLLLLSQGSSADAEVMLGNGDGSFHVGTAISTGGAQRNAIAAGDLNSDGLTDLVIGDPTQVTSLLNITNQDTAAPTAAVDITQPAVKTGDTTIKFTVTYSASSIGQIDASTIQTGNLIVTDPHGAQQTATLVSQNLGNAQNVTAEYQINTPSGAASSADQGTYTVTSTSNTAQAVKNANNVPLGGGSIGSFTVTVQTGATASNLTVGPVQGRLPASVIGGAKQGGTRVVVTNSGTQAITGTIVVKLYASASNTAVTGNSPVLATVTKKVNLRRTGQHITVNFPRFSWPTGVNGTYYLAAVATPAAGITGTPAASSVGFAGSGVKVAPPFVDLQNNWNGTFKQPVGSKNFSLSIAVKNLGNVAARGVATVTVAAASTANGGGTTTLSSKGVHVGVAAGKSGTIHTSFKFPALTGGTYNLVVTVAFPGDSDTANDTVTSPRTFTV